MNSIFVPCVLCSQEHYHALLLPLLPLAVVMAPNQLRDFYLKIMSTWVTMSASNPPCVYFGPE